MPTTRPFPTLRNGKITWRSYWFALKFAFMVPIVHTYLKLFGYNKTLILLKKLTPKKLTPTPPTNNQEFPAITIRSLVRQVRLRSPLPGTCLSRSLTLWLQLQRMGVDTELFIGTHPASSIFKAHAWLEYQGQPLNAGDHIRQQYDTFERSMITGDE